MATATAARMITHVRITQDAIEGLVVALPITPERAAELGVDPSIACDVVEIAIHPDDYDALLDEPSMAISKDARTGVLRILGLPIVDDRERR